MPEINPENNSRWKPRESQIIRATNSGIDIGRLTGELVAPVEATPAAEAATVAAPEATPDVVPVVPIKVEAVPAAENKEESEEFQRKKRITEDLELVLKPVDRNVDDTTRRENNTLVWKGIRRLESEGLVVNDYLRKDINPGEKNTEDNKILGKRKKILLEIVRRLKEGNTLNDTDLIDGDNGLILTEKGIAEMVNLSEKDVLKNGERVAPRAENVPTVKETKTKQGERVQEEKKTITQQKIERIQEYSSSLKKREGFKRLIDELTNKFGKEEEIKQAEQALIDFEKKDKEEVENLPEGEIREELKKAIDVYYAELGKTYDANGNMINSWLMTPSEGNLTRVLDNMKLIGVDGVEMSETLKNELIDIGMLHDLRSLVNTQGSVNEVMLKYAAALKGKNFDRLIHLQDRLLKGNDGSSDIVLQDLAAIDEEARRIYHNRESGLSDGGVFTLEDANLENKISGVTGGNKLSFLIARDIYRITGGEARYGNASIKTKNDKGIWIRNKNKDSDNNGSFFRKALNARKEYTDAVFEFSDGIKLNYWPQLVEHLDPGVSSFWENLWSQARDKASEEDKRIFALKPEERLACDAKAGIPPREYAVLSVEALRKLRIGSVELGKVSIGVDMDINYNVWLNDVGKMAGVMSKERAFLDNPQFDTFISLAAEYPNSTRKIEILDKKGNVIEVREINKTKYILSRLEDFINYIKIAKPGSSKSQISAKLEEYRTKGFLFVDDDELERFMKKLDLPITRGQKDAEDARAVLGDKKSLGVVARSAVGRFLDLLLKQ